MAGTTKDAKLENRTARARLRRQAEPHWRTLVAGSAALGWQRPRWLLRTYADGKYHRVFLGKADDGTAEADGEHVLSFDQAVAAARALLDRPATPAHRLTVRRAMENYIEFKHAQGQPTADLISRSTAHILPTLGDKPVVELTAERLRKWLSVMAAMPAMKRSKPDGEQAFKAEPASDEDVRRRRASANRVLTYLKAALNHAYDEGLVPRNDIWGRKLKPFRDVEVARVRYLSVAEGQRLINACDPDFRPLVEAALQTGARYGELVRLEVHDFNIDAGTIAIRRSKSGKARHVVLTDEGAEFFRQHCAGRSGSELMFHRADGAAWGASHQARPMADACARAKIEPAVGFHQLRHTWASLSVMAGVPLLVVAKNLGHTDTRMVEKHYGHLAPSYIVDAIRNGAPKFGVVGEKKLLPLR